MNKVIEQNDLIKKFDYSSLITIEDNRQAMKIIEDLVSKGNYFTNSPKYQTNINLFNLEHPVWLKYRLSFLFSVFMYLGREVKVSEMMAWSYMTNLDTEENRDMYWHHHNNNPYKKKMSGVFYLHIPDDVKDRDYAGTEFAPDGVEGDIKYFVPPSDLTWSIFPGNLWHRPGIIQSEKFRFVIAADIEIQE
jgi:hypothetical protein